MQSGIKYCGINHSKGCSIHEQNFLTNKHLCMEFILSNSFPEPSLASPHRKSSKADTYKLCSGTTQTKPKACQVKMVTMKLSMLFQKIKLLSFLSLSKLLSNNAQSHF